jgi:acetylornithine deacetylase/succinyl-diaminopimelate desuccinylase-like protein
VTTWPGDDGPGIHGFLAATAEELERALLGWVAIPSIAGAPEHADAMAWSAAHLAAGCRTAGFPRVETWPQGDSCAVFAEWPADEGAPVVLVYSHHDVRATTGEHWSETDPFRPVARDGRVFGRGAADAKGQVLAHLFGVRAHLAASGREAPAVHLKLLVDGEEELGSPNLEALFAEHRGELACDLVVFSDTTLLDAEHPAVCMSIRGTTGATLTIRGPERDVHSGAVSGASPNPIVDLGRIIAGLHDDRGRVTLPGFYDAVRTPDAALRAQYAALPFDDEEWLAASGTVRIVGEAGFTVPELLWARPALEVVSVAGGDTRGLPRAVIPASATAEISMRLVDGQDTATVQRQLRARLETEARGIRWELEPSKTPQEPYRTPDIAAVDALVEAMAVGFGTVPEAVGRMGNAGGGPAELLARTFDAPVVFFGTGLVSDRWHAPDERVQLAVLRRGAATLAAFWPRLRGRTGAGA